MNKMEKKNSFDDEALLKLLKGLKKEKTPENFEFNLMTRIRNRNFGNLEKEEKAGLLWIFIPSASIVAAAVVILVFMFNGISKNPLNSSPQVIKHKTPKTYVVVKRKSDTKQNNLEMYKIFRTENDVVINKTVKLPINERKSLPLDKYLNKSNLNLGSNGATLVSEELTPFNFDGFIPYTEVKTKHQESAKKDSLKKELRRNK